MRFALLGLVEEGLPVARAIAEDPAHEIAVAIRPAGLARELLTVAPGVRIVDDPDAAQTITDLGAAIVQGWDEEVLAAARRLAAAGVPLVLLPDARQDTAYVYELTLVRDDNAVPLVPLVPAVAHPRLRWLRDVLTGVATSPVGAVRLVRFERERPTATGVLDTADVEVDLVRDVALLRWTGGNFDRLTALHTGDANEGVTGTTVTLGGATRCEVAWSIRPGDRSRWRMEVVGADGRFELHGSDDPSRVTMTGLDVDAPDEADVGPPSLVDVVATLAGRAANGPTWGDLVRNFEVVDASRRSVRRRRTIDLLHETTSEQGQFKSQMAAGGCGVLLYCLFALVTASVVNGLGDLPPAWRRPLMILLFLPVFLFLGLQLLYFVAQPSRDGDE